jgi:hypothetical protein
LKFWTGKFEFFSSAEGKQGVDVISAAEAYFRSFDNFGSLGYWSIPASLPCHEKKKAFLINKLSTNISSVRLRSLPEDIWKFL